MGIHLVVSLIEPKGEIGETWQPACISSEFSYGFLWSGLLVRVWVATRCWGKRPDSAIGEAVSDLATVAEKSWGSGVLGVWVVSFKRLNRQTCQDSGLGTLRILRVPRADDWQVYIGGV